MHEGSLPSLCAHADQELNHNGWQWRQCTGHWRCRRGCGGPSLAPFFGRCLGWPGEQWKLGSSMRGQPGIHSKPHSPRQHRRRPRPLGGSWPAALIRQCKWKVAASVQLAAAWHQLADLFVLPLLFTAAWLAEGRARRGAANYSVVPPVGCRRPRHNCRSARTDV